MHWIGLQADQFPFPFLLLLYPVYSRDSIPSASTYILSTAEILFLLLLYPVYCRDTIPSASISCLLLLQYIIIQSTAEILFLMLLSFPLRRYHSLCAYMYPSHWQYFIPSVSILLTAKILILLLRSFPLQRLFSF